LSDHEIPAQDLIIVLALIKRPNGYSSIFHAMSHIFRKEQ
jgi:hypothetical protein